MNDQEWARIVRLLVTVLAVALASITGSACPRAGVAGVDVGLGRLTS